MSRIIRSLSPEGTRRLAERFARRIAASAPGRSAAVVALFGDLGAGKTTFVQGFARGLGIGRRPASPTFVIMRRYTIKKRRSSYAHFYHVDAYRIRKPAAMDALGFREILSDARNIVLIEWPERVKPFIPRGAAAIRFRHGIKENERSIAGL